MALINLLPNAPKKPKPVVKKRAGRVSPASTSIKIKISFSRPILIIILLYLAILIFFFMRTTIKVKTLSSLEKRIQGINLAYQKINELDEKKRKLNDTLTFLKSESKIKTLWSEKLYLINKLIPPQMWLTNIIIESKEIKLEPTVEPKKKKEPEKTANPFKTQTLETLIIKGSATSLIEAEIIASITQFVALLKEEASFNRGFQDIKLGQLQSSKEGNLTVMNFVIYCNQL